MVLCDYLCENGQKSSKSPPTPTSSAGSSFLGSSFAFSTGLGASFIVFNIGMIYLWLLWLLVQRLIRLVLSHLRGANLQCFSREGPFGKLWRRRAPF